MAENPQTLQVNLQVKEMMFDIMNKTFLTGRAREAEGAKNYEAASNMQASMDNENDYQLRRSLANTFSSLKSLLGEYLVDTTLVSNNVIQKVIDEDGVIRMDFKLPSNYNKASSDSLGNSIHSYLVDMTVADWFTITNKADAQDYISHAQVSLENAKRALYKRSRPERPSSNTYKATDEESTTKSPTIPKV